MNFSDKITLRKVTITTDSEAYPVETYVDVIVWANLKSVTRSEFYPAYGVGINATAMFEVHADDYSGQRIILHNGKEYDVIRDYQKNADKVELTCSDRAV